jgi:hypothetical protein
MHPPPASIRLSELSNPPQLPSSAGSRLIGADALMHCNSTHKKSLMSIVSSGIGFLF